MTWMTLDHYPGTLSNPKLDRQLQNHGTVEGVVGTFTEHHGSLHRGAIGSFSVPAGPQWQNGEGTLRRDQYEGSPPIRHNADKLDSGTVAQERSPGPNHIIAPHQDDYKVGSVPFARGTPNQLAFSDRGRLWSAMDSGSYIVQVGTLRNRGPGTIRAGLGDVGRIGTRKIGSFRMTVPPGHGDPSTIAVTPSHIDISPRGDVVVVDDAQNYIWFIGTEELRAGEDSRLGTQHIGSFGSAGADFTALQATGRNRLWTTDFNASDYALLFGTNPLRAGTDSRMGTRRIGSFIFSSITAIGLDSRDQVYVSTSADGPERVGTIAVRSAEPGRIGTDPRGGFNLSSPQRGAPIDPDYHAWTIDTTGIQGAAVRSRMGFGTSGVFDNAEPHPDPRFDTDRPRRIHVTVDFSPGAATESRVVITQSHLGTLASGAAPGGVSAGFEETLSADILPRMGSWFIRDINDNASLVEFKGYEVR